MGSSQTYGLPVFQNSYVVPNDLRVSEWRPSVHIRLSYKLFHSSSSWGHEKWFSGDTVKESILFVTIGNHFLDPWFLYLFVILSTEPRPISVVVRDPVSGVSIDLELEVLLDRLIWSSMGLLWHNWLLSSDRELPIGVSWFHSTCGHSNDGHYSR